MTMVLTLMMLTLVRQRALQICVFARHYNSYAYS